MFWLGQSHDPRAIDLFEELLTKRVDSWRGLQSDLRPAVIQPAHGAADPVHRRRVDEPRAVHLSDDSDHCRHSWRHHGRRGAPAALADGATHLHLRARTRARICVGGSVRGTHGHTVRCGEHQPVAVLRHGESPDHRGAGDARRDSSPGTGVAPARAQRRRAREEAFTVSSSWARPRDSWPHRARPL